MSKDKRISNHIKKTISINKQILEKFKEHEKRTGANLTKTINIALEKFLDEMLEKTKI
ncbi:MAG: hypothetical protein KJ697_03970 [Nanoarchaeota archaeon]|nr:hypothetical protein [Nanoarchaeota archaeon]